MNHIIFDGSNILWRSHWVMSQYSNGHEYQDISILMHSLHNICDAMHTYNVHFTWDDRECADKPNLRNTLLPEYKQNRSKEDTGVYTHVDLLKRLVTLLGGNHYRPYQLEGDDAMAILCNELSGNKIIVTADQDMMQLISPTVSVYNLNKKTLIRYDNFLEHYPVIPERYVTYKCIIGDKSDNVEGVPRYGTKKATTLTNLIHENVEEVDEDIMKIVDANRKIMDLSALADEQEIQFIKSQMIDVEPDINEFRRVCQEYKLEKVLKLQWLSFFLTLK